jgi:S-adenosylmethionine:tRNA ribosyltransferase-isomerase
MKLSDFDYNLPKELISQSPLEKRAESRLLIAYKSGKIEHKKFHDFVDCLKKDDVLVINETKVIRCVLEGKKETGIYARIVLLKKIDDLTYDCLIKTNHPRKGIKMFFDGFSGEIITQDNGIFTVRFDKKIDLIAKKLAKVLLPDYVKNKNISEEQYQTVYSKKYGSLAAPTAGLHFTKNLLEKIKKKRIKIAKICLHVSYGTFLPVSSEDFTKHKMEKEYFEISKESADLINNANRLFVVGTTSLKTLETCADKNGKIIARNGFSDLFITPKYKIKTKIHGFITNFHLPKSTLLLLVSSFWGREEVLKLYEIAIKEKYRFYSFGDAMMMIND